MVLLEQTTQSTSYGLKLTIFGIMDRAGSYRTIFAASSIGTGIPTLKAFQDSPVDVAKALVSIALDTENVAETFQRHHAPLFQENRAFRFNVVRGLEDVGLEEASKQGHILAVTRRYFESEDVFGRLEKCSHVIQGNQNCVSS